MYPKTHCVSTSGGTIMLKKKIDFRIDFVLPIIESVSQNGIDVESIL